MSLNKSEIILEVKKRSLNKDKSFSFGAICVKEYTNSVHKVRREWAFYAKSAEAVNF